MSTASHHDDTAPARPISAAWAARLSWVVTTLTGAIALDHSLSGADAVARVVVPVAWWLVVAGIIVALVVPSPSGLTAVRLVSPLTVALAVATILTDAPLAWGAAFLASSMITVGIFLSAEFATVMVQGSAYGAEVRILLRAPAAVLPPMLVMWAVWAASTVSALALLTRSRFLAGAPLAVVSVAAGFVLFPRYHRLARRWLVLVPAGVVVHDPLVLGETFMVSRSDVAHVGLAPADTEAADLSGPATGHLVEVELRDMALAVLPATADHPRGRAIHVRSYLVAPSRPGRALRQMAAARLPVG